MIQVLPASCGCTRFVFLLSFLMNFPDRAHSMSRYVCKSNGLRCSHLQIASSIMDSDPIPLCISVLCCI